MSDLLVTWNWNVSTPLHIGSGFSRAGFVDRCVRLEGDRAVIPSEAVKGAIRGAAEQLARWLGSQVTENEADSIPRIPVLQRLFAPDEHKSLYRFCGCVSANAVSAFSVSSTKINSETRSAEDNTLRTIEMLPRGMRFDGR